MTTTPPRTPRYTWRAAARDLFTDAQEAHPDLSAAALTALYAACDLIDAAEAMQHTVNTDGVIVRGSQGQPVAHPLIAEVRHYRREALSILRTLGSDARSPASAAAASLANKRWASRRGSFVGVRPSSPRL